MSGFEEENKTKPLISSKIAELGGLVEPKLIVGPLIKAVEAGDSEYSIGIDGWFCSRQTSGMGGTNSVFNCFAELTLSNIFNFISLIYRKIILDIIKKHQNNE